jgi:hypothetical protein
MGSVDALSWSNAADLFEDLDLDDLYLRQVGVINRETCKNYPYTLLVFSGKITLGINLGNHTVGADEPAPYGELTALDNGELLLHLTPYLDNCLEEDCPEQTVEDDLSKKKIDKKPCAKKPKHKNEE